MTARHRQQRTSRRRIGVALTVTAILGAPLLIAGSTVAQDVPNPSLKLSYGLSANADDNLALDPVSRGTSTYIDNRVGLAYQSETRVSMLKVDAGGVFRLSDLPQRGRDASFDDRSFRFSYDREGDTSRLTVRGAYNKSDIAFFDPLSLAADRNLPIDQGDLVTGRRGDRISYNAGIRLQTGIGRPLGFNLAADRYDRTYSGTNDPRNFDTRRTNLSFQTVVRPDPRLNLNFTVSQDDYASDNFENTDRRSRRATAGVGYDLDPSTQLTASLGYTRIVTDRTFQNVRGSEEKSGLNGSLGLTREMQNGTFGVLVTHDLSVDRKSFTEVLFSRSMDLPTGTLALSIGPNFQGGGPSLVGSINYGQELALGSISAFASREVNQDRNAESNREVTRVQVNLQRPLNALTGIGVGYDYISVASDVTGRDSSRGRINLTVTRSLTEDWQLLGGYSHIYSDRELEGTAKSNSVFVTLKRGLTFAF